MKAFIIQIAIGAILWFVLPVFLNGVIKSKSSRNAAGILCKIIAIVVIALAVFDLASDLFS
ncbi:MAG: hypothetical protein NC102_09080 [Clostridium sp.]|nr:hypothetical protein [Clostridium sp.]